jgi:hypothetical protein
MTLRCWWCGRPNGPDHLPVRYHRRGCWLLPQPPEQLCLWED